MFECLTDRENGTVVLPAPRTDTDAMSEKTPLISTPGNMPLGPKTKDYAMVLLWPFALAVCFAALFIFLVIVPPVHKISLYSVVTLIAMLLPCVPVITAVAFVATSVCPRPPTHTHAKSRSAALCCSCACCFCCCRGSSTKHTKHSGRSRALRLFSWKQQSKKVGNVHFWTTVAVCTLVACLTLTNDRILEGSDVSHYCSEHNFHCGAGVDLLTDVTLGGILVTVVFGVLGASAASSLTKKLDLPPMPINA